MDEERPLTHTIYFDPPLEFGGKTADKVELREPMASEYIAASAKPGYGLAQDLMASVGKLSAPLAAKVPISKLVEADAFFARFLRQAEPKEPEILPPQPGDDALFATMVLREPTVEEITTSGVGALGTARLVSMVTGVPFETCRRMPISKVREADAFFSGFVPPSPGTGNI